MENKKAFVEGTLQETIKEAYGNVEHVKFATIKFERSELSKKDYDEYVIIKYNCGLIKTICVTANSLKAIVLEVFRELN